MRHYVKEAVVWEMLICWGLLSGSSPSWNPPADCKEALWLLGDARRRKWDLLLKAPAELIAGREYQVSEPIWEPIRQPRTSAKLTWDRRTAPTGSQTHEKNNTFFLFRLLSCGVGVLCISKEWKSHRVSKSWVILMALLQNIIYWSLSLDWPESWF